MHVFANNGFPDDDFASIGIEFRPRRFDRDRVLDKVGAGADQLTGADAQPLSQTKRTPFNEAMTLREIENRGLHGGR